MKKYTVITLLLLTFNSFSQDVKTINKKLLAAYDKISFFAKDTSVKAFENLEKANNDFEKLLLKYTADNPKTIYYDFKSLTDKGLRIASSEDSLFRIYTWNTNEGGTMRFYRNVFQYKNGGKVFSKTYRITTKEENDDPGCIYNQVNYVVSNNKKFYVAQSVAVLSSALSDHYVKIFSIDGDTLNDNAKLIKTKTGIKNTLSYDVDLTTAANRGKDVPDFGIKYDAIKKSISIPVILENGKVTSKRIVYQFNGTVFEKLPL